MSRHAELCRRAVGTLHRRGAALSQSVRGRASWHAPVLDHRSRQVPGATGTSYVPLRPQHCLRRERIMLRAVSKRTRRVLSSARGAAPSARGGNKQQRPMQLVQLRTHSVADGALPACHLLPTMPERPHGLLRAPGATTASSATTCKQRDHRGHRRGRQRQPWRQRPRRRQPWPRRQRRRRQPWRQRRRCMSYSATTANHAAAGAERPSDPEGPRALQGSSAIPSPAGYF